MYQILREIPGISVLIIINLAIGRRERNQLGQTLTQFPVHRYVIILAASGTRKEHIKRKMHRSVIVVIIIFAVVVTGLLALRGRFPIGTKAPIKDRYPPDQKTEEAGFVGSQACAECHREQFDLWKGSHHDLAMQVASEQSVRGDFNNAEFTYYGKKTTFYRRNGHYMVRTDGPDGKLDDYEIKYTFGVYPLQQYLIEFPDGRLQALGIAWDSRPESEGGKRWFHLYPNEKITHDDELHWTGINQNWNFMCAECHSTDVKKRYDFNVKTFNTTWSELNVSCEACHGPGSTHVLWAKRMKGLEKSLADEDDGLKVHFEKYDDRDWVVDHNTGNARRTKKGSSNVEIDVCARCHSRRTLMWDEYIYGNPLMDTHMPTLLEEGIYYPDGQIEEEVYEYGSFIQSKMYQKGVTCTDCHDPHSLKLRAEGNQVCLQCHLAEKYDSKSHHFHDMNSSGARCVGCHMVSKTYMVIDPRHDHSIRIPRPDFSIKFSTPNACNNCHSDRSFEWADELIDKWHAAKQSDTHDYVEAIYKGRRGEALAEEMLIELAEDASKPNIARATAYSQLGQYLSPISIESMKKGLNDDDPLVRSGALDAIESVDPSMRFNLASRLLKDPIRVVRMKAARSLAPVPRTILTNAQTLALDRALSEYIRSQESNADRPEAHLNLGNLYAELGQFDDAGSQYQKALELYPRFVMAYVNLADLYRLQNDDEKGEQILNEALKISPDSAEVYQSLGLLYTRQGRMSEAVVALGKSAELGSDNPHYSYVYAIALNSTGKPDDAIRALKEASSRNPNDREILYALTTISRDNGRKDDAKTYAEKLVELSPGNPLYNNLLEQVKEGD